MAGKSEQVNIDITARDKASRVIDGVADDVEDLERANPEIEVRADTRQAEQALAALSREDIEVVLRAKADALRGELAQVQSDIKALDASVEVTVDTAKARSSIDDLEGAAKRSSGVSANAIRDIGGVVNEQAAGMAGDFAEAFEGIAEQAEQLGPRAQAALGWVSNLGIGAVAVGGAIWALSKINDLVNSVIGYGGTAKVVMNDLAAAADLATAAVAAQRAEQELFANQGLWDRLSQASSGYYDSSKARGKAFNDVLEQSPAIAQKWIDVIKNSGKYKLVEPGDIVTQEERKNLIIIERKEVEKYQKAVDDKRTAEINARIAQEQWNDSVAKGYDAAKQKADDFTTAVNGIPPNKNTDINVTSNAAQVDRELNQAARDRSGRIVMEVVDSGRNVRVPPGGQWVPFAGNGAAAARVTNVNINVRPSTTQSPAAQAKSIANALQSLQPMTG